MTRAGFYMWQHKPLSARAIEDPRLLSLIRHSYIARSGVYGVRHVFLELRKTGEIRGIHRVESIMRTHKI